MTKPCETCRRYLPPGKRAPSGEGPWPRGVCTSPRMANRFGIIALSIARGFGGACGPDGKGWAAS